MKNCKEIRKALKGQNQERAGKEAGTVTQKSVQM